MIATPETSVFKVLRLRGCDILLWATLYSWCVNEVPWMDRKQCGDCHIIYLYWDHSVSCCLKSTKLILLESLLTEVCIMSVFAWTYFFQGWWEPHWTAHIWDYRTNFNKKIKLIKGTYDDAPTHYETLMSYDLLAGGHGIQATKKRKFPTPLFQAS